MKQYLLRERERLEKTLKYVNFNFNMLKYEDCKFPCRNLMLEQNLVGKFWDFFVWDWRESFTTVQNLLQF